MATIGSSPMSSMQSRIKKHIVTDPPKFDLESYIQNYKGRTRIDRLIHIGSCSTFLGPDALKLAIREAKNGKDVGKYLEAQMHLQTVAPQEPEASKDQTWIDSTVRRNNLEVGRLELELKGYKNNLIKESTRMGNEDLGKIYQAMGDLPRAFEAFGRMRPDALFAKHIVDVSLHLIEVAIEQKNWIAVTSNIAKIKANSPPPSPEDVPMQPYISAIEGLALFDGCQYPDAATYFLNTEAGMGSSCSAIISPNDVAIYGGLCALATMERHELQRRVLDNSGFRTYLELEPQIRRAIGFFINSRYTACLGILEGYRTDYYLDLYLYKHVDELYQKIRSKCIVQYFIPFSSVTLDSMNAAFAQSGKTIDKELATMIHRGDLNAKINTVDRLLEAVSSNPRADLQHEALDMAASYEREACLRILHLSISMADLEVKGVKRGGGQPIASNDHFGGSHDPHLRPPPGGGF